MAEKGKHGHSNLALWISIVSLVVVLAMTLMGFTLLDLEDKSEKEKQIERMVNEAIDKRLKALDHYLREKVKHQQSPEGTSEGATTGQPVKFLKITSPADGAELSQDSITIVGIHSLPLYSHVWLILEDADGNYYIHHPPVLLRNDGTWQAGNIRIIDGITRIIALDVDADGNDLLESKIREGGWGVMKELPPNSRIWDDIRVSVLR